MIATFTGSVIDMHVVISKYDPRLRDENGHHPDEPWTGPDIIGEKYGVSEKEYMKVEDGYMAVIYSIFYSLELSEISIAFLIGGYESSYINEYKSMPYYNHYAESWRAFERLSPKKDQTFSIGDAEPLIRGVLRGVLPVSFDFENGGYIRFGHDFYVGMGSDREFKWESPNFIFVEEADGPSFKVDDEW